MFQSIIIYTLLLVVMVAFGQSSTSAERRWERKGEGNVRCLTWNEWIPILIFSALMGMRYDVGTDHLQYMDSYLSVLPERWELFFLEYSQFCQDHNVHFTLYFGFIAFVQIFCLYYTFRNSRFLYPALFFFFIMSNTFVFWCNGIRQSLAFCIWLPFIQYIEKRNFLIYVIGCTIAFFFHRSAAFLIIMYPLLMTGKDWFKLMPIQWLLIIIAFVISFVFADIFKSLENLVEQYSMVMGRGVYDTSFLEEEAEEHSLVASSTGIGELILLFSHLAVVYFSAEMKVFYKNNRFFVILYSLFFIGFLIDIILPKGALSLSRPFYYFTALDFIILAYLTYYLKSVRKNNMSLLRYGLMLLYALMFYGHIITSNAKAHLWYQFFFNHV